MSLRSFIQKGRDWAKENPDKMENIKGLFSGKKEDEEEDQDQSFRSMARSSATPQTFELEKEKPPYLMYGAAALVILLVLFRKKLKF